MRLVRPLLILVALAGLVFSPLRGATAATPASGTLATDGSKTQWSGVHPFPDVAGPSQCPTGVEPFCDVYELTVPALTSERPNLFISAVADDYHDVIQLFVYGPDGTMVAHDSSPSSNLSVTIVNAPAGSYSVRTEAVLFAPPSTGTYRGVAFATSRVPIPLDDQGACSDTVATFVTPPEVLAAAATDDGRIVKLNVLVLLDGVDEAFATGVFESVAVPYAELGIEVVPTFQVVPTAGPDSFEGRETVGLIRQLRERFPEGKVPAQYDLVELLTNRDVYALGQDAIAGQADCLGGIEYRTRAYEVSEAVVPGLPDDGTPFGPVTLAAKVAAKITAHEMGHLLGGQHHYANCVEGVDPATEPADFGPCTLMFNSADMLSLRFSAVNAKVVRGYALLYAAQNDDDVTPVVPEAPAGAALLPLAAIALGLLAVVVLRRRQPSA